MDELEKMLDEKKLIAENQIYWFYQTMATNDATKYAHEKSLNWIVVLGTSKEDNTSTYVIIDQNKNDYVYDSHSYESILYFIDISSFNQSFEED